MKNLFIILTIVLLPFSRADSLNCIQSIGDGYFDLTPLSSNQDYSIEIAPNISLVFNICRFTVKQCGINSTFANLFSNQTELECITLTNNTKFYGVQYDAVSKFKKFIIIEADESGDELLQMLFTGGDHVNKTIDGWSPVSAEDLVGNAKQRYNFALQFHCLNEIPIQIGNWSFDTEDFTYYVHIYTQYGCPLVTLDQISDFIYDNKIIFFIVGIVIGILECLLGLKLFLPTLFVFGFFTGFFFTLFTFFGSVITPSSQTSTKWLLIVLSILLGVTFGNAAVKMRRMGIFCIGAWLGIVLGLLLYQAFIYKFDNSDAVAFIVTLVVFGVGLGGLAIWKEKHLIILATSFCGAYLSIRSLSLLIGHFPNEITIIHALQSHEVPVVEWPFYVYMNAVIMITVFSMCAQYKIKRYYEKKKQMFEFEAGDYIKNDEV